MEAKLTTDNVSRIFLDCLFNDGEDTSNHVKAEAVKLNVGFHPGRLESHKEEIKEILNELPDQFKKDSGGGWTFLNACVRSDDEQWGDQSSVDQLVALGLATGQVAFLMERPLWPSFPGGMPYFVVN